MVTDRNRNDPKTAAPPRPTPAWVTAHKAGNLEHTAQPAGSSTGWRVSFPGASVGLSLFQAAQAGLCFFQAAGLVSESSLQLCLFNVFQIFIFLYPVSLF